MENGANKQNLGGLKGLAERLAGFLRRADKRMLPIVLAVALLATALGDGYQYNRGRAVTAYVVENAVALKGDQFYETGEIELYGLAGLSVRYLRKHLFLQGHQEFELQKENTAADIAVITFGEPKNQTYEVSLRMPSANTTLRWRINEPTMTAALVKSSIVRGESIYITFSQPVKESSLRQYLQISELGTDDFDLRVTGMVAEIRLNPEYYSSWYNLYLPRDITDEHGIMMVESYHFEVAVRDTRTTIKRPYTVSLTGNATEILKPGQDFAMEFSTNALYWPTEEVTVTAYRFESVDTYAETADLYKLSNEKFYDPADSDTMSALATASTTLRQGLSQVSMENPGLGAYMLEAVFHNPLTETTDRIRKMILVSDLSVYAQSVNGQTLIWLNSITTGGALAGHTIEFTDSKNEVVLSGATDAEGIAVLEGRRNPYEDSDWFHWVRVRDAAGTNIYADTTNVLSWNWSEQNNHYFSYFYLDRGIYKPNDEISFWGYLKGHQSNTQPTPGEVKVVFDPGGLEIEVTATVDANNIFHGVIPLEKVKSSHYNVSVMLPYSGSEYQRNDDGDVELVDVSGERALHTEYIQVKEFQKPLFVISAENDKPFYNYDEDVTATVTPKFYDGTPLPNYELEYVVYSSYYGDEAVKGTVLTDDEGKADIVFPAFQINKQPFGWRPTTGRYKIMIKSDGEDISYTGTYTYFPTDRMVRASTEVDPDCKATLKVLVNRIDLSSIKTLEDLQAIDRANYYYYDDTYQYDDDAYKVLVGAAADTTVTASITMNYYSYQNKYESIKKTLKLETSGGSAEQELDLAKFFGVQLNTGNSCWLDVSYEIKDSQDRRVAYSQSAYKASRGTSEYRGGGTAPEKPEEEQFYEGYSFDVTNDKGESAIGDYVPYQDYDKVWFNAGENFTLTLRYDGKPAANNGRMLYTVIQDKIIRRGFTTSTQLHFTETTEYANNIKIVAAYFDGRNTHTIRDVDVGLASDSIRLNIESTTDKADYRPGEQATVNVKVTDQSGKGVRGNVLVSIVDEAIFALREQSTEVLGTLYRDAYYSNYHVKKYSTIMRALPEEGKGDGGKGDEGDVVFDESTRKNFRDTAIFQTLRTDDNGNASFTFTLPDNITSWRVTSLGIGDNLYAGQAQSNFVTTQPFFISPVVSGKYIEGDDVALQVRGYGTALSAGDQVSFTVTMEGDRYSKTFTASNVAFAASHINFGRLPVGEYTLTATAQHALSRDTVILPVTVISSNLELVVNRPVDLTQPLEMNVMRYPVTMSFYSKEHEPYFKTVSSLLKHYCNIANQRMSRYTAKRALMSFMDPNDVPRYLLDGTDSVSDMQNSDGGIAWYSGNDSDVELTAKVLLLAKDQFNLNQMKLYFNQQIEYHGYDLTPSSELGQAKPKHKPDRDRVCYAYLGLAALGEPVVEQIYGILALPDTKIEQQAILVAALAYAGDDGALNAYTKYITPSVDRRSEGSSIRYYTYPNEYKNERVTANAWVAASALGHADADQYALYFGRHRWAISTLFEAMIYVTNYSKPVQPIQFRYEMNGETHEVDLGLTGRMTMKLNQSGFESFKMLSVPGDLAATAYYIGEPSEADIETSENIRIEKTIKPLGNQRYNITLTMTFADEAETGQYDISDWVPSNLRMYDIKRSYGQQYWSAYSTTEGQKIYFRLWRDSATVKTATISYTVREVFEAGAMVDSTYIIHGDSGDSNLTPRYRWDIPEE